MRGTTTTAAVVMTSSRRREATVTVTGAIDGAVAPQLEAGFDRLRALGWRRLVLDFAGVPFVDAAGLTARFHAAKHARRQGDEAVLRHANHRLLRLLELALLGPASGIEPSVDQVA